MVVKDTKGMGDSTREAATSTQEKRFALFRPNEIDGEDNALCGKGSHQSPKIQKQDLLPQCKSSI